MARQANVLRLGHVYSFFAHEAGSTPLLAFKATTLYITKGVEISTSLLHFALIPDRYHVVGD